MNMNRDILLIRHGQTAWNAEGRLQGWNDNPLDPTGRDQIAHMGRYLRAHVLADALRLGQPIGLWSSPIGRAVESARGLRAAAGIPSDITHHDGVREFDMGAWSGALIHDLRDDPRWQAFLTNPGAVTFPDGESFTDAQRRGRAALDDILAREPAEVCVIVSHGGLLKSLLLALLDLPATMYRRFYINNASLTHVRVTPENGFTFRCINHTAPISP